MYLKSIKLIGFKSFVDPTTISFPSNLVAIVGPNGSGKSNIIDAIRWVLGESSASSLRSGSMADVIFNGSIARKPVGQATVEIVFDNSAGRMGGAYAEFAQIAIKRQVSRDGQSNYYLNGTRCRRRDIVDLFLGTGLGDCNYAIVMQDMVTRLIESKPDELRSFLEEGAGVSKYKERKRETEQHIKHARDNLLRVNDLSEELAKQLSHLESQARAAERYQVLKQEEHQIQLNLLAWHWRELETQGQQQEINVNEATLVLDEKQGLLQTLDNNLDNERINHREVSEQVSTLQNRYHEVHNNITRVQQQIQHQQARVAELQQNQTQVQTRLQQVQQQLEQARTRYTELGEQEQLAQSQIENMRTEGQTADESLQQAEEAMQQWQVQWDSFNQQATLHQKQSHEINVRVQYLQQRIAEGAQKITKLETENASYQSSTLQQQVTEVQQQIDDVTVQKNQSQQQVQQLQEEIVATRKLSQEQTQELEQQRSKLLQLQGQFTSLSALQKAALNEEDPSLAEWLARLELKDLPRLASLLKVESGWELAVETVLARYLQGICVAEFGGIWNQLGEFPQGEVMLVGHERNEAALSMHDRKGTLITKITGLPTSLLALLEPIHTAENLEQAQELLQQIPAGASVVAKTGVWLGHGWIYKTDDQDIKSGVIQRARELKQLQQEINQATAEQQQATEQLQATREKLQQLEQSEQQQSQSLRKIADSLSHYQADHQVKLAQLKQTELRVQALTQELTQVSQQQSQLNEELTALQTQQKDLTQLVVADEQQKETLSQQRQNQRDNLEKLRVSAREYQKNIQAAQLQHQNIKSELATQANSIEYLQKELANLQTQTQELAQKLEEISVPNTESDGELVVLQQQMQIAEGEVAQAKQQAHQIDQKVQVLTTERNQLLQQSTQLRNRSEQLRLELQSVIVRKAELDKRIEEHNVTADTLVQALPSELTLADLEQQHDKNSRRLERLGAINMAAIEEHTKLLERKVELDSQASDLEAALQTLDNTIRKIDEETQFRFRETYEKLNANFAELFPQVFGGGSACLELTSDDMLTAGVSIVASPPGKRTKSIHMLSGGEKALTALTLIFSLFRLNPAPFCVLDEVDAALDDMNVQRYCQLIQNMAKEVQFLFISHNKLALTAANQLIGVTTGEPGVSRIVAVDVEAAIAMAGVSA